MEQRFDRFTLLISSLYQGIQKLKTQEMEELGLRSGHGFCLHQLYERREGLTLKELTALCELDKAAVSRYLAGLEERGLAAREEKEDRRYNRRWHLTPEGERLAAETDRRIGRAVENVGSFLTDPEREVLYRSLEQIKDSLQQYLQERTQEASDGTHRDRFSE